MVKKTLSFYLIIIGVVVLISTLFGGVEKFSNQPSCTGGVVSTSVGQCVCQADKIAVSNGDSTACCYPGQGFNSSTNRCECLPESTWSPTANKCD